MLGKQRLLLPSAKGTPALVQAATARSASMRVSAKGFSHQTGLPTSATAQNLPKVKGMRCSQKDRLHTGIGHNLFEFSGQFKAVSGRKIAHQLGLLADSADEAQAIAFALNSLDDIFSPSAEADHSSVYHG
jgi:hypothetical protein